MKKFLFIAAVSALAFFAGSCQRENLEPVAGGTTVTYTVNVPDAIATKADDGVTNLIYEVYRAAEVADLSKDPIYKGEATLTSGTASLELEFVKNQNFKVLFWAQDPDVTAYDTDDLRAVTLATSLTANDADLAVFAGSDDVEDCVSKAGGNVSLVRPVSQINIATSPESLKVGTETSYTEVGLVASSATVKNGLYQVYNVANKNVSEAKDFEYTSAAVPAGTLKVGTTDYTYVAMNYVGFAPESGATVDVDFTIVTSEGDIEHSVSSVPVKANYKTNIIGNLITASDNYQVILGAWGTPDTNVEVVAVSTAQDLQEAIDNIQPGVEGNIILEGNIDLSALFGASTLSVTKAGNSQLPIVIPAEKAMTLDLNGFTITTPLEDESAGKHYYAFENHGTLTILDSKGTGKIVARGNFNYGKMTLESGTINACDGNGGYGVRNYEGAEFVMNGGTIATTYEDGDIPGEGYDASPIRVDEGAKALINGGIINNVSNYTVDIDNYGETIVNDGTFTSVHTTLANSAVMTINGGSFTCNGLEGITAHALWAAAGTTTINGGTFDGKDNYNGFNVDASAGAVVNITGGKFLQVHSGSLYGEGTINVTGGEFFDDPAERVADGYIVEQENGNYVVYKAVATIGETMYKSIEDAIEAVETSATITVLCDAEMTGNAKIAAGKTVVIDLNGCTISAVDNTEKNYQIIQNNGNLTIKNSADNTAKMTVKATINSGWNRYSAVIANTVGGNLTVEENVVLEHLGGTDMAYGIDNLTNGKGTTAVTTINGATVKSPYRAVRQFLNGIEATNELYVKAGSELRGDNKSIFFHDPSKNANTGKLVVEEGARLYGDVYLFVTAGSTEWPVEVSIAASALADASEVLSGNVPSGYAIIKDNETWKVVDNAIATAEEFKAFRDKVNAGETFAGKTVVLANDIDLNNEEWIPIGSATADHGFMGNFDGNGKTIRNLKMTKLTTDSDNYVYAGLFGVTEGTESQENYIKDLVIENVTIETSGHIAAAAIAYPYYTTVENITVKGNINIKGGNYTAGVLAYTRRCVNAKDLAIEGNTGSSITGNTTVGGVISDIQMNGGLTANYSNFSAEGLTIQAVQNVGGISGIIASQALDGATVKNVTLVCDDSRTGIVAGALGGISTIKNIVTENVTGATNIVGGTYDNGAEVVRNGDEFTAKN